MWEDIPRSSFMNIFDNRRMMLPYEGFAGPLDPHHQPKPPRHFLLHIPRVIPDQKARFEGDDIFKKLSREAEVRLIHFIVNLLFFVSFFDTHPSQARQLLPGVKAGSTFTPFHPDSTPGILNSLPCEDGRYLVSARCVSVSNPESLSSSEKRVNPAIRS
jgi:hypothetical protein